MDRSSKKVVRIKDMGRVVTGSTPPTQHKEYYGSEYLFIKPSDLSPNIRQIISTETTLSQLGSELQKGKALPKHATCVVCIGTIGKIGLTSRLSFTNQQINSVIANEENYDPLYVYYLLATAIPRVRKLEGGSASGREIVKKSLFENIEVEVHSLPVQRKIAAILSAYDNLIENNTRRIKILGEMAQTLYREWFVHFRFPGHENVRMVDSPVGRIPEEWEVKTFGEVALNFDSRRKPLSSMQRAQRSGEYPYYGAAKILDYIDDFIFDGKYLLIAEDGSVITPNGKPVLQLVNAKFWVNNHTHIIQGKIPISTEFLYYRLLDLEISGYITGAAQPKITQANLNRIPVVVPTDHILLQFNEMAENCESEIINLQRKSENLRRTRDLLLPELVSNGLCVQGLETDMISQKS